MEGEIPGYHCWTEVYGAARGWIPLDAREARKSGRSDDYFSQLASSSRWAATWCWSPAQESEPLNYWIYPYAELNGEPLQSIPWTLHFRRLPIYTARD